MKKELFLIIILLLIEAILASIALQIDVATFPYPIEYLCLLITFLGLVGIGCFIGLIIIILKYIMKELKKN